MLSNVEIRKSILVIPVFSSYLGFDGMREDYELKIMTKVSVI